MINQVSCPFYWRKVSNERYELIHGVTTAVLSYVRRIKKHWNVETWVYNYTDYATRDGAQRACVQDHIKKGSLSY